jgi:hypothetical protein
VLALLATAFTAGEAAGQSVEGSVIAVDHDRPLPGATVLLLGPDSAPVDSARADSLGRFRLTADSAGPYLLHVRYEGFLTTTEWVSLEPGAPLEHRVEMPLISAEAARGIQDLIEREDALQLPLAEICGEPLRPWEAGLLVGVTRDRTTLEPVAGAAVVVTPLGADDDAGLPPPRTVVSTASGAYWLCNLPAGRVRVVAAADGFRPDTTLAVIRAGTVSWYDALMSRSR